MISSVVQCGLCGERIVTSDFCPRSQVRERDLPFVMHTLATEFTILRVVNGETVAADNLGITNGFVKPKLGEDLRWPSLLGTVLGNQQSLWLQ